MQAAGSEQTLVIYAAIDSPRLRYVLDWIFTERLGIEYRLTSDEAEAQQTEFYLSYGKNSGKALSIPATKLLNDTGISQHKADTGEWQGIPTLYAVNDETYAIPFDLFSAAFFLLSRYEEYYSFNPDKHQRYPATESILYRNGWLKRPVLDEWVTALGKILRDKGLKTNRPAFFFQPSYDIDIAYSYLHKGRTRSIGAFIRDLLKVNTSEITERISVNRGKKQDPFDSFDTITNWHKQYNYSPVYFILASLQTTDFDKNIRPTNPRMQELIRELSDDGAIGIHPSYYSDRFPEYKNKEKGILEQIIGKPIDKSRQHYMKLKMPGTYRSLIALGIEDDYSMGYGTNLGFRAGTGASFMWYDLKKEEASQLRVHPFCFMDTTARYEEKLSPAEAVHVLNGMKKVLEQCNSMLVTIFHNFSLGTSPEWKGWREAYENFIKR
ncbi:MAG TPA: polysaccharide deacetylase family protein [Flavipsychrobacter sp.]|nr:polysaccharide deacetylase family protein [Flavipsychrobacter sp.]